MGKKTKTGKQRKDRYYQLAKETGYRSRAAFKLIQLNRKFEFLQRSKVLIDLCAAPGGWLQVAAKYMPVSSVIVGVDLVPIKSIHNVITIQDDIMTQHCRSQLKKELKTWKADVVLHDGAPNVGRSWLHDAFNQVRLTLSALHLATEFLMRGGWFVTKVFRSKDYNALMWVLGKLFQKVHATKPQASRHESAEIFVVCQNFLAPDKIDAKFFDPSYLFDDVEMKGESEKRKADLLKPVSKQKKAKAEGYEDGDLTLYHKLNASHFIKSANHMELLSSCNEIVIDEKEIAEHVLTTNELRECCKDIKVLGRKELLSIIAWRRKLKSELYKEEKSEKPGVDEGYEKGEEEKEVDEIDEIVDNENREFKKKKRKILKERKKLNERMNLKMVLKNDQLVEEDDMELFSLKRIKGKSLKHVEEVNVSDLDGEVNVSDDDEEDMKGKMTRNQISYDKESRAKDWDDDGDGDEEGSEAEENGMEDEMEFDEIEKGEDMSDDNESQSDNELIVPLNQDNELDKTKMFFENKVFQLDLSDDEEDEELELDLVTSKFDKSTDNKQKATKAVKTKPERKLEDSSDDTSDSDSDDELDEMNGSMKYSKHNSNSNGIEEKCKKKVTLSPEELALGSIMIQSKKSKRDVLDNAWNRFTHGDEQLPSWFRKDEEKFFRKDMPVSDEVVDDYKMKLKDINARPIKKVAEAKARKRKRALVKLERAKKRAESITNAVDMTDREKASLIKNAYKKALKGKEKTVQYVVSKKHRGNSRPKGVKGRYKVVDPRMKKDKKESKDKKDKGKKKKSSSKSRKPQKGRKGGRQLSSGRRSKR